MKYRDESHHLWKKLNSYQEAEIWKDCIFLYSPMWKAPENQNKKGWNQLKCWTLTPLKWRQTNGLAQVWLDVYMTNFTTNKHLNLSIPLQNTRSQRYRFSLIINELKQAETTPYKTSLMGFINAILISTPDFETRIHMRNEFIGLQLLDILSSMRWELSSEKFELLCWVFQLSLKLVCNELLLLKSEHLSPCGDFWKNMAFNG